jgi:hypothetical protein
MMAAQMVQFSYGDCIDEYILFHLTTCSTDVTDYVHRVQHFIYYDSSFNVHIGH